MKNKLISDLTSQTKAGRGMAGAPGAAVTQEKPEQNHCGTLYIGAQHKTNIVISQYEHNHQHILYEGAQDQHHYHSVREYNTSTSYKSSWTMYLNRATSTMVYKVHKSPTHSKGVFF